MKILDAEYFEAIAGGDGGGPDGILKRDGGEYMGAIVTVPVVLFRDADGIRVVKNTYTLHVQCAGLEPEEFAAALTAVGESLAGCILTGEATLAPRGES